MQFLRFVAAMAAMFGVSSGRPTEDRAVQHQMTSPSIIQSAMYAVEDSMAAHNRIASNIGRIFKEANVNTEATNVTMGKVREQVGEMLREFAEAAWTVEGDLKEAIPRIGDNEAALIKKSMDQLVGLAKAIENRGDALSRKEKKDVLKLLNEDGLAVASSLRAILTPIQEFVHVSEEDAGSPGALQQSEDDVEEAAIVLDNFIGNFLPSVTTHSHSHVHGHAARASGMHRPRATSV